MNNLYVSTNCLAKSTREAVKELADAGLNDIELGPTQEYDDGIEDFLASLDARFIVHNYFPPPREPFIMNFASADPAIRERSLAQARASIDFCVRVRSTLFSVHAGFMADPAFGKSHFRFECPRPAKGDFEKAFQRFTASVKELLSYAAPRGVKIAIENNVCPEAARDYVLLCQASEFERLMKEIPSPHLGINLDLGHLKVSARTFNFDREDFARRVSRHVFALHVHDNDGVTDTHQPIAENSWVFPLINGHDFSGQLHIILEAHHLSIQEIRAQIDLLRKRIPAR